MASVCGLMFVPHGSPVGSPQLLPTGVCLAGVGCPYSRHPKGLGTGLGFGGVPGGRT